MEKKWAFIFHTIFIWSMYVLMFYITSLAIPELKNVSLAAILVGFILASFSIAATNGGFGSYPEAIVIAFSIFAIAEDSKSCIWMDYVGFTNFNDNYYWWYITHLSPNL